ncbi:MAG TPA: hypothetical protein DCY81_09210 [Lachnospiraceae bacterium]|nr:hypothetical protein [Lachnospiraceae bacterium]
MYKNILFFSFDVIEGGIFVKIKCPVDKSAGNGIFKIYKRRSGMKEEGGRRSVKSGFLSL